MIKKKILMLNRRDLKNPFSGGAEIYTHEILKRLTNDYEIDHFSSVFPGSLKNEIIDGINYVRCGSEMTCHLFGAYKAYSQRKKYDIIIDQFNGIGFMTFFLKNSFILIHQLYDEFWISEMGKKGHVFRLIEKMLLKLYKNKKAVTISESTVNDLVHMGLKPENIEIVYCGNYLTEYEPKEKLVDTVSYLGRLRKTKNPEGAVLAFLEMQIINPDLKMNVIGDGPDSERLKEKYADNKSINFAGYVDEKTKIDMIRNSDLLLVPSVREGWGMVVIQAAMCGTPSVGFDVHGLRDSIVENETGNFVPFNDYKSMAEKALNILSDAENYCRMSKNCIERAKQFTWEESASNMGGFLLRFLKTPL